MTGASENSEDGMLLRMLTPLIKLYTAKQAVAVASEALEGFGGAGFIEDSGLPVLLRDAQVLPIWEGTTNVLAHDLLRVLETTKGKAFAVFANTVSARCNAVKEAKLPEGWKQRAEKVSIATLTALQVLKTVIGRAGSGHADALTALARDLAFSCSRVYMASCLIEHASWSGSKADWSVAERWVNLDEAPLTPRTLLLTTQAAEDAVSQRLSDNKQLALDLDSQGKARGCGDIGKDGKPRSKL
jgi:hypothetical protein